MNKEEIKKLIRNYVSEHVFSGKLASDFTDDTLLVSTRIINSIIVMHMINHFEEVLKIELEAHEVNIDNLDSVNIMAEFFENKINARKG